MKTIKIIMLVAGLTATSPAHASPVGQTVFGNQQSSFLISSNSYMNIKPTGGVTFYRGNLTNTGGGIVEGNPIYFDFGTYNYFNAQMNLNGVLQPARNTGGTIQLGAESPNGFGVMIANPGGLSGVTVQAQEGQSLMRGQPLFFGANKLSITDENTIFLVAVQNTVNTNIALNGGLFILQDDLRLGDSAIITGDGAIHLNSRRLLLGGQDATWTGNISWSSALDIQFNSAVSLQGTWTFEDIGQINGNGNVLDLRGTAESPGGEIIVAPGATLSISSVQIKGIGDNTDPLGNLLGKIRLADDATLQLSDVVIEMDDSYTVVSGTWYINGSSTVVTKGNILRFADSEDGTTNGHLTVDRVSLTYDTLATLDQNNIQPILITDPTSKYITILGNGDIRSVKQDSVTFHNYRSDSLLQKYAIVAPYRKFYVYPSLDGSTQVFDVVIDGNTNFLGFTLTDEPVFIISDGVHATTQNMILRDVSPKHFSFGVGSSLLFGDKTMLSLARNEVLDYQWTFEGNTILRGTGQVLDLGTSGSLVLQGENSTLLLDGIILKGIRGNNIRCTSNTSTIKMRGVKWVQEADFTFSTGGIQLVDDVTMVGPNRFTYASTQPFAILADATLFLCRNLTFDWRGTVNGLQLADDGSAAMQLDQVRVQADGGLVLNTPGRLIVRNANYKVGKGTINFDSLYKDFSGSFK
ncbi:hypothetical protein FJ365_05140 [Candidatus Dependentiae bacterium]|nr:hypothetical protein [Candidatus Dependentiae bacterium]